MSTLTEPTLPTKGHLIPAFALVAAHAFALLILYFVPVFIFPTVANRFARLEIPETPMFASAHYLSDLFAARTSPYIAISVAYLVFLFGRSRARSRWLSAFSHVVLLAIALFGMVFTAWMINPLNFVQ